MPLPIPGYSRPLPQPGGTTWTPPPTAWEGFGATVRDAFNRNIGRDESEGDAAYQVLIQPLVDQGQPMDRYMIPTIGGPVMNRQAIYADALAARAKNPKMFASLPQSQAEYDKQWQKEFQADMAKDSATISRTGWAPWLAGGIVGGMANPINLASLGAGGAGGGLMRVMAREAVVNGIITAADQPFQALEAGAQGRQFSMGEAALNTAFGAAAGAAFGGAIHGAGMGWDAAKPIVGNALNRVSEPFAKAMASHWDRLPAGLQERWMAAAKIDGMPISDSLVADTGEAIIGREFLAGHEAAAVGMLRREGQIDAASPFKPDGAGDSTHREALAEVLTRIMADQRGGLPVRQRLSTGTGLAGGSVMGDPVSIFSTRLAGVESSGNPAAKAATSSATGLYQFTRGTWLNYFKQRFGETGLSEAEILAKRTNPAVQNAVMAHATADYQAKLRAMGEAVTPGNLYIMHFAGEARARRIFAAEAGASAESVMGHAAVEANPWLRDMTAGELLAWADRKMGGNGAVVRGPGAEIDPAAVPDPAMREAMQAEIDAMRLENARMRAEMGDAGPSISRAVEDAAAIEPTPVEHEAIAPDAAPAPAQSAPETGFAPEALSIEVRSIMPELQKIVADRSRTINDIAGLARELGANEQDVRQGLMAMAMDGAITQRKDGRFARKAPAPSGPEDVLDFIARKGGIRDDEGHKLGLKNLSPEQAAGFASAPARERAQARKQTGLRDWQRMTRRNGPLLRHKGMSVDQVGEALHEAGYLNGADGGRPTTAEVLAYLDQRISDGKPRYTQEDQGLAQAQAEQFQAELEQMGADASGADLSRWPTPDSRPDIERAFNAWDNFAPADQAALQKVLSNGDMIPSDVDPWVWQRTADLADTFINDHPMEIRQAFAQAVDDYTRLTMRDMHAEAGDPGYSEADYEWHSDGPGHGPQDFHDAQGGGRQPFDPADPNAGSAGGAPDGSVAGQGPALSDLPQAETTRFLDPQGEAAKVQADSLLHDAQAEIASVEDPRLTATERAALERAILPESKGGAGWSKDSPAGQLVQKMLDAGQAIGKNEEDHLVQAIHLMDQADGQPWATRNPAIAARQSQEAQLRAQAPLRGENRTGQAQDGTMGLGLFDAADQPTFRLDAEGPEMTMPDLLKMLDEEQADIDSMRTCMVPMAKPKGE